MYVDMFSDKFIQDHSSYKTFEQLWNDNQSRLKDELSFFDYLKTEEWNKFLKKNTDFDDHVGMEFAAKLNDFRVNGKHWFSNK